MSMSGAHLRRALSLRYPLQQQQHLRPTARPMSGQERTLATATRRGEEEQEEQEEQRSSQRQ